MKYITVKHRLPRHILTTPVIFLAIVPIIILDLYVEIFHRFAFPFYKIPYVKRKNYIRIDRHKLSYLNPLQKLYCAYCGYSNGILQYWIRIFGETEKYWCGIQHSEGKGFLPQSHHSEFIKYDNKEEYIEVYESKKTPLL